MMPCLKKSNGKWGIGRKGKGIYKTKTECEIALKGYYASQSKKGGKK